MPTYFEWVVEHIDEHGDVTDVFHGDKLAKVLPWVGEVPSGHRAEIGLVRDQIDSGGHPHRSWAYVDGNELPDEFDNGCRVPKRFCAEWVRAGAQGNQTIGGVSDG